jgi:[ribosomal protein S5]-alanine N-acetyltransferase
LTGTANEFELIPATPEFLRLLVAGDYESAGNLLNVVVLTGWPHNTEATEGLAWHLLALNRQPADFLWRIRLIVLSSTRCVIGSINLKGPPDEDGTVEIGWGVNEEQRRKGFATRATKLIMQWVFTQPGAERVIATVPPHNLASRRVAERVGMSETGEVRRGLPVWKLTKKA